MTRYSVMTTLSLVFFGYTKAYAISTYTYQVIQESASLVISLACLFLAVTIYAALKGGSLSTPWLFFVIAFSFAAVSGIMHLLDLFKILIYQYDLRPATLITTCGTLIFLLLGLYFYRRGLE